MTRFLIVTSAAILLLGPAAEAAPTGGVTASGVVASPHRDDFGQGWRKQRAIFAVLREGKAIQIADGGKLTDQHRAELERKLTAVQAGNY